MSRKFKGLLILLVICFTASADTFKALQGWADHRLPGSTRWPFPPLHSNGRSLWHLSQPNVPVST